MKATEFEIIKASGYCLIKKVEFLSKLIINEMVYFTEQDAFIQSIDNPLKATVVNSSAELVKKLEKVIDGIFGYAVYVLRQNLSIGIFIQNALNDLKFFLKGSENLKLIKYKHFLDS